MHEGRLARGGGGDLHICQLEGVDEDAGRLFWFGIGSSCAADSDLHLPRIFTGSFSYQRVIAMTMRSLTLLQGAAHPSIGSGGTLKVHSSRFVAFTMYMLMY